MSSLDRLRDNGEGDSMAQREGTLNILCSLMLSVTRTRLIRNSILHQVLFHCFAAFQNSGDSYKHTPPPPDPLYYTHSSHYVCY